MDKKSLFDLPPPPPQPPPGWHGSPYSDQLTYTGSLDPLDPVLGTLSVSQVAARPSFRASTPKGEQSFSDVRDALEWVEKQAKYDAGRPEREKSAAEILKTFSSPTEGMLDELSRAVQTRPGWRKGDQKADVAYTGTDQALSSESTLGTVSVDPDASRPFVATTLKNRWRFDEAVAALEWVEKQAKKNPPVHLAWARMSGKTPCGKSLGDLTIQVTTRLDGQGVTCPECASWFQNEPESKRLVAAALVAIQDEFEIAKAGQLGARFCVQSAMLNVKPLVDEIERLRALVLKPTEKT